MKHLIAAAIVLLLTCSPSFGESVHATAYAENPGHSASGAKLRRGTIAVSQDLLRCGFSFGKHVLIEGVGECIIVDVMPKRWHRRIDVWMPSRKEALEFGIIKTTIELVEEER